MTKSPITHGGPDRRYEMCQCSKCGTVQQCVPGYDFFTTTDDLGPLLCSDCFANYADELLANRRRFQGLIYIPTNK